jgi:hypothetical protein
MREARAGVEIVGPQIMICPRILYNEAHMITGHGTKKLSLLATGSLGASGSFAFAGASGDFFAAGNIVNECVVNESVVDESVVNEFVVNQTVVK